MGRKDGEAVIVGRIGIVVSLLKMISILETSKYVDRYPNATRKVLGCQSLNELPLASSYSAVTCLKMRSGRK